MNPALLLPAALAALAALAIPIVIHIARRTEMRPIAFAALRWLDQRPRPRRRLRIDERWLLAVRLLLLAAIALWLAQPVLLGAGDTRRVIAVAPGVDPPANAGDGARMVWLADGFPAVDAAPPPAPANIVSLIRQLDADLPPETPLDFVVPATLEVDAERPRLSRTVGWRIVPQRRAQEAPSPIAMPALTVRHDAASSDAARYFRAVVVAWATGDTLDIAPLDAPIAVQARHLIWLGKGPLPDAIARWIERGGTALVAHDVLLAGEGEPRVVWRDAVARPLAVSQRMGQGRAIRFTRALQPAEMPELVEPGFPDALAEMLSPTPPPARVAATDHVPLSGVMAYPQPPHDLRPWLAILIALIFAVERWIATRQRRTIAR